MESWNKSNFKIKTYVKTNDIKFILSTKSILFIKREGKKDVIPR